MLHNEAATIIKEHGSEPPRQRLALINLETLEFVLDVLNDAIDDLWAEDGIFKLESTSSIKVDETGAPNTNFCAI